MCVWRSQLHAEWGFFARIKGNYSKWCKTNRRLRTWLVHGMPLRHLWSFTAIHGHSWRSRSFVAVPGPSMCPMVSGHSILGAFTCWRGTRQGLLDLIVWMRLNSIKWLRAFRSLCLMLSWNWQQPFQRRDSAANCPMSYLFISFLWVHFAVLSVSSLCTNEQSVADLATFNDRTDCNTSRNISGHICPAIGVFCSNSCLDMDYRSRHMLICVCMCVKTIIASRMGPVCQEHRRLQPGAQDKPNTEDSVPWCSLYSVESCDARGWCGMVVDGRWLVYRMLCAICDHSLSFMAVHDHSWPFLVLHCASWSFYICNIHILKRNETRAAYSGLFVWCWVETDNSLSSAWTELQIVPFVYLFSLFPRKYWVHCSFVSPFTLHKWTKCCRFSHIQWQNRLQHIQKYLRPYMSSHRCFL